MDPKTLQAYDQRAPDYAREWNHQAPPSDMYALLLRHFRPGPTVDVGCGSGRDLAWLSAQGFDALGVEASSGLLTQARTLHPDLRFALMHLPELEGLKAGSLQNVLCETVIMHLPEAQVAAATRRLRELLRPGGTLYLSWRVTPDASIRDAAGRLYSAFDRRLVREALGSVEVLLDDESTSLSSGKRVHRLIVRV
ncbi:methyltransferase domain-containing protein [Pseudomonas sp. App30]|uniref:class I SAM-dependent methyltransferase n=1 Tax=Pseudomonas sp. App30 TaxID=3068990 RepID=UPI003A80795B